VGEGAFVRDGWITLRLGGREEAVCPVSEIPLRGAHNVENVLAATACAAWAGVPAARLRAAIRGFPGVPHRLERVRERAGVVFYNDSKGTNVDATIKALASFDEPIVLIAGGRDKGQDFTPLAAAAAGRVKAAVLIGEGRAALGAVLSPVTRVQAAESMRAAVRQAALLAAPGEVVLLSPYEHRGEVFTAEVRTLEPGA
jgi:UDP-N-acetylmuramoylalanine--D-glutamate ligase